MSRLTLPIEKGYEDLVLDLINLWGADAIRNSDGTKLNEFFEKLDLKIYSTYFCIREDQEWIRNNLSEMQNMALISDRKVAFNDELEIDLMQSYYKEQLSINEDSVDYWQVIDRTINKEIDKKNWIYEKGIVKIKNVEKFHEYTVNFFANQLWDITHMYNSLTNNWNVQKSIPYDVVYENTRNHLYKHLRKWCEKNKDVDVVRFTTFFYHFSIMYNEHAKQKFGDWFGYSSSVSPKMFEEFKKNKGYDLTLEDIVDNGYYNNQFRIPSDKFLDFIDFMQNFVTSIARKCVDIVHEYNKEAIMFVGDNWIGTEPYGEYFKKMNLDGVAGSAECGVDIRMVADLDNIKIKEIRFLPYFFPDTFYEGNNPHLEWEYNWVRSRRAILAKKVDRIGFGGYLSLVSKFDKFVSAVKKSCDEFNEIHNLTFNEESIKSNNKIAILNSWGKIKSWQCNRTGHASGIKENTSYIGVLEALSGLPYDISFVNFEDIKNKEKLNKFDIIINVGEENTAFSGGYKFNDNKVLENLREFVYNGKVLIGVGDPSVYNQDMLLKDIFGVNKEFGNTLQFSKYMELSKGSLKRKVDIGNKTRFIYQIDKNLEILQLNNEYGIEVSKNKYGKGTGIYIAGLPFSFENTKFLYDIILNSTNEKNIKYISDNCYIEVYEFSKYIALINNKNEEIVTNISNLGSITLKPYELKWIEKEEI